MHISNIPTRPINLPSFSGNPQASSVGGFQLPSSPLRSPAAPPMNISGTTSLDSQTVSALLQTQDLNEVQGHGGGGGGHHGMKMLTSLEAEEASGNEEARQMQRRKKLLKTAFTDSATESNETEEENSDPEKNETEYPQDNFFNRF